MIRLGAVLSLGQPEKSRGIEPLTAESQAGAEPSQNCAKSKQISALGESDDGAGEQKLALPEQYPGTSAHEKCATCVQQMESSDRDLTALLEAWPVLAAGVKVQIIDLVRDELSARGL